MEKDTVLLSNPADHRNWLYGPDFVVGVHYGNQNRGRRHGAPHIIRVDVTEPIYRQVSDLGPEPLQKPARAEDRRMLDLRRDNVRTFHLPGEEDSF